MTAPIREKMIAKVAAQREELRQRNPREFTAKCGAEFSDGVLRVKFYGEPYVITFPELSVRVEATQKECGLNRSSMFFYYFLTADGTPLAGKWVAFRDLPGGMFYHQAYQGYSGNRLAKAIDNRVGVFERAAQNLGGMKLDLGDAAFAFDALPRVRVAAVYHVGDEDFPASANVLFDESASHYLPTDALAGVGSALVDRLTGAESRDDEE
ncbi:MAG: DUF3786 domain-containing protein [Chloroflexota bacterium]|nr:DUF3786 domain-containing protein [Chloroflexota bacterium]